MKIRIILSVLLLISVILHAQTRTESTTVSNGNTKVTISENETTYELDAAFDERYVMDVYRYINSVISPGSLFTSKEDRLDVTTTLKDGTTFRIKAYMGTLYVKFDKEKNSRESFDRIRMLCEGVKKLVL